MPTLKQRASELWTQQRARRPWLDHAVRAWTQLNDTNGSLLAGSLTFFSFLALFPLILLGVSVVGFVLAADQELQQRLLNKVAEQAPGQFGKTISDSIQTAIDAKAGIGIVALIGVLLTGLGWINNLRQATEQVWGHLNEKRTFLAAKAADLIVLVGLGAALLVSVGLTAAGSALSGTILDAIGIGGGVGARVIAAAVGLIVALAADLLIFGFLLVRLPKADVSPGLAFRGALLAAVGFEILKVFGTYYMARVAASPTIGAFGSILGVLVWLNLVFRHLLYCTAWTATGSSVQPAVARGLAPVGTRGAALVPGDGAAETPPATTRPRRGLAWAVVLGALARRGRKKGNA